MTGVAVLAAAAAAGSLSAEQCKQVQSWPSCSSTLGDENDARAPIRDSRLLLVGRCRPAPSPSCCTRSSAASNSGDATSSWAARRVRWACAGPRCLGGSEAPRGEGRGAGGITVQLGRGAGGSQGSAGAQRSPGSRGRRARAARCLPGALRWEWRRTRGRRRAGPSSHTPGPGCH